MENSTSIELAYDYAKMSLEQELKRFEALDSKSNSFLSLISVVLGVLVTVIGWGFQKFFPPNTAMKCLIVLLLFLTTSSLSVAWYYLFKSIKVTNFPTLKLDKAVCEKLCDFDAENIKTIIYSYYKLLNTHKDVMFTKVNYVETSYRYISAGAMFTLISLFFIMISQQ